MSLPVRLILLPFLQGYDGAQLSVHLLIAPQTDPTTPPSPGLTPYVSTNFEFELCFVSDPSQLPTFGAPATRLSHASPAPVASASICSALNTRFGIDGTVGPIDGRIGAPRILKYAPPGYRQATGYGGGHPNLLTDDSYHCAIKAPPPSGTSLKVSPPVMSWGKVLAQALRQPLLARSIGLVRHVMVTPPADIVANGGWLYLELKAGSPWSALSGIPGALRHYATRVPKLSGPRALFTPVLFPVRAVAPAGLPFDELFRESIEYDDGFAKAVYGRQPKQADPIADEGVERPSEDSGVQLGWDDEQIVTWFNRQVDSGATAADAPMGVMGYRIDVREAGGSAWESLVRVRTPVDLDGIAIEAAEIDWRIEVAPNRLIGDVGGRSWLPSYLTAWTGRPMIGIDSLAARLRGVPTPEGLVQSLPTITTLRYGRTYEFRVRFTDLTGGGPNALDTLRNGGPQPVATIEFRRFIRPTGVRIAPRLPLEADPLDPPQSVEVSKPLLSFPACLMAGGLESDLDTDVGPARLAERAPGIPDPDVDSVEISIEVATPQPAGANRYSLLYTVTRAFPVVGSLKLDFEWVDIPDAHDVPVHLTGPLALPTSRTVRLLLTPLAANKPDYYGGEDVRRGESTALVLRSPAKDEREILAQGGGSLIEAFYLQPAEARSPAQVAAQKSAGLGDLAPEDPLGRLAAALDLDRAGTTLRSRRGQRLIVGASASLRHVVGPDGASLTFATGNEMTRMWLVASLLKLRRDWSWDGLDHVRIERDGQVVGRIQSSTSAGHEASGETNRDHSTLLFLDAIAPNAAPGVHPRPLSPEYRITPVFRAAPVQEDAPLIATIRLPVTTPPAQVPRLISAGLALSPYRRDHTYSATEERQKAVWLEFDRAPDDPEDRYYARVLATAPDPVLTDDVTDIPHLQDLPLPIDPEPIRRIVPGQGDDRAGQSSMQMLLPTSSPVHFLLPLPPGIETGSPELFGFFTYEFRVGHFGIWSTAQGFAGRALRVAGIQHAPPPLSCAVTRSKGRLTVSAAFADPVRDGRSIRPTPPVTELWALLYARVHQADHDDYRNILLGARRLESRRRKRYQRGFRHESAEGVSADLDGKTEWSSAEISAGLELLTLGPDAPLSCLVVETLPGESPYADPLMDQLGYERFLRTSPLTAIPAIC